jgi:hypothetical protein
MLLSADPFSFVWMVCVCVEYEVRGYVTKSGMYK